jgi:hypothetical protein
MIRIVILFLLAFWLGIACFVIFLSPKPTKNKLAVRIVTLCFLMLPFCGWWLYMTIDGYRSYQAGVEACKQAKITIYVPYEKWREMVGGHEAWLKLADYEEKSENELSNEEKQKYPQTLNFGGVEYHFNYLTHKRVLAYYSDYYKFNDYADLKSYLYYDWETKTVLYTYTWFPKNYSSGLTVSNLLGIRNGHKECKPKEEHDTYAYYFYRK